MRPFWKMKSGQFAGWRDGVHFYNAHGEHAGFFDGDLLYSLANGGYVGEVYEDRWLGKKQGPIRSPKQSLPAKRSSISAAVPAAIPSRGSMGWDEPTV